MDREPSESYSPSIIMRKTSNYYIIYLRSQSDGRKFWDEKVKDRPTRNLVHEMKRYGVKGVDIFTPIFIMIECPYKTSNFLDYKYFVNLRYRLCVYETCTNNSFINYQILC